jgi:hypothetical protein
MCIAVCMVVLPCSFVIRDFRSFETLVITYKTVLCHSSEDHIHHLHLLENLQFSPECHTPNYALHTNARLKYCLSSWRIDLTFKDKCVARMRRTILTRNQKTSADPHFSKCSYKKFEIMFLGQHLARESCSTVQSILREDRQFLAVYVWSDDSLRREVSDVCTGLWKQHGLGP